MVKPGSFNIDSGFPSHIEISRIFLNNFIAVLHFITINFIIKIYHFTFVLLLQSFSIFVCIQKLQVFLVSALLVKLTKETFTKNF